MNEESLNMQIRKFVKKVDINARQKIETTLCKAAANGRLNADSAHY